MARQKGIFRFKGMQDGKIFYQMNGEDFVRDSSAPSPQKVKKDPAYEAFRNQSGEFGAASSIASCFKRAFGSSINHVSDKKLYRRLCVLFNNIVRNGDGQHGQRPFKMLPNDRLFKGFQFKELYSFNNVFKVPFCLHVSDNRKDIEFSTVEFCPSSAIAKVPGATHFRLILYALTFSDYEISEPNKKYVPVAADVHCLGAMGVSEFITLDDVAYSVTINTHLDVASVLSESVAIIACVGIEFYQEAAGKFYLLEGGSCMEINKIV